MGDALRWQRVFVRNGYRRWDRFEGGKRLARHGGHQSSRVHLDSRNNSPSSRQYWRRFTTTPSSRLRRSTLARTPDRQRTDSDYERAIDAGR